LPRRLVVVKGVGAPFSYGIQAEGDVFSVYISKNDHYPTRNPQTQVFYTRIPDQRVVSLPVYGGDNLESASSNQKQGEALALLPPGQPKGTEVLVTLWLDADGVFGLTAHLANGEALPCRILQGEADHKAIEALEEVEARFDEAAKALPEQEIERVNEEKGRLLGEWVKGDYEAVVEDAERLARDLKTPEDKHLKRKTEALAGFTDFILDHYEWALTPDQRFRLMKQADFAKRALADDDSLKIKDACKELETETDHLPEHVMGLVCARHAISQIGSRDPVAANNLMEELERIEQLFRMEDSRAQAALGGLMRRLSEAVDMDVALEQDLCWKCGRSVSYGRSRCPHCDANLRIPVKDSQGTA
jgi:hypothetical protein